MLGVLIVPTGIGCEIGGHAGDANPVAKLLGSCCDKLILHPNVVNASDINEMPENSLYVEGSILDSFLEGCIDLVEVRKQNRIFVAVNKPARNDTINAVSAARATIGVDASVIELKDCLRMKATMECGVATGQVDGVDALCKQLETSDFDALAIHTSIDVSRDVALKYYREGGINPWGGVEAKASRMIAERIGKPVAHAPLESIELDDDLYSIFLSEAVDPRIAPEAVSVCYLHCVLKGLNRAPGLTTGSGSVKCSDVDFMVSPYGCFGRPHIACVKANIPIIFVRENSTVLCSHECDKSIVVENYLEAAGIVMSMRAGISPSSVRRPLHYTRVVS